MSIKRYQVKFVGSKPFIDQYGIFFEDGKEDKYIFLAIALQILRSLDFSQKKLHRIRLTTEEILKMLEKYEPDLKEKIKIEEEKYEKDFAKKLQDIESYTYLKTIEKKVWIGNEIIMKEYIFQRHINKIYYHHCINDIKHIIKKEHIKEIDLPFTGEDWHILHSIQDELENGKDYIPTTLKTQVEDDILYVKLYIKIES